MVRVVLALWNLESRRCLAGHSASFLFYHVQFKVVLARDNDKPPAFFTLPSGVSKTTLGDIISAALKSSDEVSSIALPGDGYGDISPSGLPVLSIPILSILSQAPRVSKQQARISRERTVKRRRLTLTPFRCLGAFLAGRGRGS